MRAAEEIVAHASARIDDHGLWRHPRTENEVALARLHGEAGARRSGPPRLTRHRRATAPLEAEVSVEQNAAEQQACHQRRHCGYSMTITSLGSRWNAAAAVPGSTSWSMRKRI